MPTKYLFALLSIVAITAGCNMMDRQSAPSITTPPPYWQSHSQLAGGQLADIRAFHEREAAEMSEGMQVFRNREMERLAATGKELEREETRKPPQQQESFSNTPAQRERWSWTNWTSRFRTQSKDNTLSVSEGNRNVR